MGKKANKANILVRVCYSPPNQDEGADAIFYGQLGEVSQLPALVLVLVGDFSPPMSAGNTTCREVNSVLSSLWGDGQL